MTLPLVPKKFMTYEMCFLAVGGIEWVFGTQELDVVPSKYRTLEVYSKWLMDILDGAIKYVPEENRGRLRSMLAAKLVNN